MSNILFYNDQELTQLHSAGTVGELAGLYYPSYGGHGYWTYGSGDDQVRIYCIGQSGGQTVQPGSMVATSIISLAEAAAVSSDTKVLYASNGTKVTYKHTQGDFRLYALEILIGETYHTCFISSIGTSVAISYDHTQETIEGLYLYTAEHPTVEEDPNAPPLICLGIKKISRQGSVSDFVRLMGWSLNAFEITDEQRYTPVKTTRKGGGGRGVYPSTAAEQPNTAARNSWFSWASGNGYGICYYVVDPSTLSNYLAYIYSQGLLRDHQLYRDATIGAYKLPVTPPTLANLGLIYVANLTMSNGVSQADPISQRFVEGGTGVINISGYGYDTFADYTDTTMCLYLPFYGQINLDVNVFVQGSIEIKWLVDCYNGNICYWVYAKGAEDPRMILYGTYSGNCAIEIPIVGSGVSGTVLGKITNLAGTLAVGAASGNAGSIISGVGSALANNRIVDRAGTIDANANASCPYAITLQVSHRVMLTPTGYREQIGIPSASPGKDDPETVSGFSGYTRFVNFHADHISGATDREKAEIERLMNGGVFV